MQCRLTERIADLDNSVILMTYPETVRGRIATSSALEKLRDGKRRGAGDEMELKSRRAQKESVFQGMERQIDWEGGEKIEAPWRDHGART